MNKKCGFSTKKLLWVLPIINIKSESVLRASFRLTNLEKFQFLEAPGKGNSVTGRRSVHRTLFYPIRKSYQTMS